MSSDVQYWPLAIGWTIVLLLTLFGWKRQAALAAAGMAIVTYAVLSVGMGARRGARSAPPSATWRASTRCLASLSGTTVPVP